LTIDQTSFSLIFELHSAHAAKDGAFRDRGGIQPPIKSFFHPDWDRDGSDVAALSVEVYDRPVVVTLLKVSKRQGGQFRSTQPAVKEDCQDGMVTPVTDWIATRNGEQLLALSRRKPVSKPDSETFRALYPPDAGSHIRIEQANVGRLVGKATNRSQSEIDLRWREASSFQLVPISQDYSPTKRQTGLGTVPGDEILNRASIGSLWRHRAKTLQDWRFRMIDVG
jgi:hypothetical protein